MIDNSDAGTVAVTWLMDRGDRMKVLIAVKGTEQPSFFTTILELGCLTGAEAALVAHVVNVEARAGIEGGRERFMMHRSLSATRSGQIEAAELEAAQTVLQTAHDVLVPGGIPDERFHRTVLRGRPTETLRQLAEEQSIDLIVVGGRPGLPGPHSVGKTARFLVDHAPRAALLVRSR